MPTLDEQGLANFDARVWMGLFAPAGTPPDLISRLQSVAFKVVGSPEFAAKLSAAGAKPWPGTSEDLLKFLASEIARWAVIVKEVGVQPE